MSKLLSPISWFTGSLRALNFWQYATLTAIVVASAVTTFAVYYNTISAEQVDLAEDEQLIPVRIGDLINQVSTNGSLAFPERETLAFSSTGEVAGLLTAEGQPVSRGDVLARLDDSTMVRLGEAVVQAEAALYDAEVALSDVREELAREDLDLRVAEAAAEEQVADAEYRLQQARDALADAQAPYSNDALQAQYEAVADAELAWHEAEDVLADLDTENSEALVEALRNLAGAELALAAAREALADYEPDLAFQIPEAAQTQTNSSIAVMKAEAALERYQNVNQDWLGSRLRELEEAEDNIAETQQELDRFRQYDERHPGSFGHLMSQWEYFLSEYEGQRERLMELLADYHKLQADLVVAEDELRQAEVRLGELGEGPDVLQLRDLEAAVQLAESESEQGRTAVAELQPGVDPLLAQLRQRQVEAAKAGWEQSLADLEEMLAGGDPLEVELRRKQVELAETTLEQARYELLLVSRTDREQELALRESEIVLAQQDVVDARRLLDEAVIRSPLDGVVGVVHVEAGDRVKAEGAIVEVIDTGIVEIDGVVDEIDVLSISPGTPAEVIFDALRDEVFNGTVTEVASAGANQQGVVTYAITTRVDLPEGVQLREGLTAVANMVLNQERGVLLVPQQALYGTFELPTVRVMTELGIEERPVRLGSSDDFWVAVDDGLQEGDTIVMEGAEVSTTGSGFRQLRTISGGSRRRP